MLLNPEGQGLTEYIILVMLVAVVGIASVNGLSKVMRKKFTDARNSINEKVTVDGK